MAVPQRLTRVGVAVASAALLSSCMLAADVTTLNPYAPSDGTRVQVADGVAVENLLVLTEGEGEVGHVVGSIVNNTLEPVTVQLDVGETGAPAPFEVPAESHIPLHEANVTIEAVEGAPGSTLPTAVQGPGGFSSVIEIPVLDGTLAEYSEFLEQADSPESGSESSS
ncbi:hypothetical protein ACPYO6_08395 [Georgenia sp. Z1344]|uniref:hypothetical protein n=1 Tax=Georgenia sp. Z1344 TaxID=3416706 RepID=UPI003CF93B6B